MHRHLPLLVGLVLVAALGGRGGSLTTDAEARLAAYDRSDRQAVINAFYDTWLRNQNVPLGWTGTVSGCRAGQVSDAARAATLGQINYFRAVAGLRPVTLNADLGAVAQRTALMMDANNQLSHDPPSSWACRTDAADRLARRSNLALGTGANGAKAVNRYVIDSGSSNTAAGHRRWLLNPRTSVMAAGSTSTANALAVIGMPQHTASVPRWVPWPAAGYFPSPLEPNGRWSLSASHARTDFSRASATVTDASGRRYSVRHHPLVNGYGPRTLVWQVYDLRRPAVGENLAYRVRVSGIYRDGVRLPAVSYTVTMVKPDRVVRMLESPEVRGTFAVGQALVATPGTWFPQTDQVSYQWFRDGVALPGQDNALYRVQPADADHTLSVAVRAQPAYYQPGRVVLSGPVSGEPVSGEPVPGD